MDANARSYREVVYILKLNLTELLDLPLVSSTNLRLNLELEADSRAVLEGWKRVDPWYEFSIGTPGIVVTIYDFRE